MSVEQGELRWSSGMNRRGGQWLSLNVQGVQAGVAVLWPGEEPGVMTLTDLHVYEPTGRKAVRARRAVLKDVPEGVSLRRQGLGTRLLLAALELARQEGHRRVRLYVTPQDLAARPWLPDWYAKHGFVEDLERWATRDWRTYIRTL